MAIRQGRTYLALYKFKTIAIFSKTASRVKLIGVQISILKEKGIEDIDDIILAGADALHNSIDRIAFERDALI